MAVFKFLQVSDFHLGRPFGWVAPDRRAQRRHDQRRALEQSVQQAIERGAMAILIPGDLFDQECVDADTLAFAVHAFDVAGCPPVFIAPGNHDPYSDVSHYWNPQILKARVGNWPAHVHVFATPAWSGKAVKGLEGVTIWGRCATSGVASSERPLAVEMLKDVHAAKGGINVALFHGSREEHCPPNQKLVAPFSDEEVKRAPFDYLAVGHYHDASRLEVDGGRVRLAYTGAAIALDVTEIGTHGGMLVRLVYGDGPTRVELESVKLDPRKVFAIEAEVTGCTSAEQVDRRVAREMDRAAVSEQDIVTVRLSGRLGKGVRYAAPGPELRARAFYVRVNLANVRPDYDLDALRADTSGATESRFAAALLEKLDAEKDPEQRAAIEGALYYGLDAFRLGEVVPAYEDLGA